MGIASFTARYLSRSLEQHYPSAFLLNSSSNVLFIRLCSSAGEIVNCSYRTQELHVITNSLLVSHVNAKLDPKWFRKTLGSVGVKMEIWAADMTTEECSQDIRELKQTP
jgi:hypothetical protein